MQRFKIDENNRLLIKEKRKEITTCGRYKIDPLNQLIYFPHKPKDWCSNYSFPQKLTFTGRWGISPQHDLELYLIKNRCFFQREPLVLKGEILSSNSDSFLFKIKSYDERGIQRVQILELKGKWFTDDYNRLNFLVEKKTFSDTLILEGSWQINPQQQIIYTYEKTDLKTKTKALNTIEFEGFWQIDSKDKLTYILSKGKKSQFDFRVQLESPNLYPQEGVIKYRLGVGLRKERTKIIYLYGAWKFSSKGTLYFQMDYGKSGLKNIEFLSSVNLTKKDELSFSLYNQRNQPLGISVIFSHRFLKKLDANLYLKIKENLKREKSIEAGITIPF